MRCECSGGGGGPGECDFDGGASCGFGGEDPLCYCETPIIVSYRGNGLQLTDTFFGVNFDLNADGIAERLAWTTGQADDAFLTLDRNANGVVDDGTELFGNRTDQPASSNPNGFRALATFDAPENGGNADGIINADDAVFAHLKLWADSNHDGVSQPAELRPASQTIIAFDLAYRESRRTDQYGNQFRYISQVQMNREISGPSRKFAVDVVLGTER